MLRIILTFLSIISPLTLADQPQNADSIPKEDFVFQASTWSIAAGLTNIEQKAAFEECVDDTAFYLNFTYTQQDGHFIYGAGMTGYLFDDKCKFRQDVEDTWGDRHTASSSANGFGFFGELGYSHPIKPEAIHFDTLFGLEKLWAERSISNCSNCYSEDIDINAGFYLKPQFKFIRESGFTIIVGAQIFPSAEINNNIFISFGSTQDFF
ncbi:hypothetical protein [Pleionea sediminis]|uniref:hypothetical protein n=1 Tax=Pleionea sediminis TaxID=2569479 RepID=UPI00118603EE|nr:hypothetical protein [Pleionea sediminis]